VGSIPIEMVPHVHVVVRNAIELLRSWEPQENNNWAMLREADVMANLIAAFGHQKCYVDEILTTGSHMYSYVQLLLQWTTWRGPATHQWSRLMQGLLSALLSGLELSETKHSSPTPANVAVLEPVCCKLIATLASDVGRFRTFKPKYLGKLNEVLDQCSTDAERRTVMLDVHNEPIDFYGGVASRELKACLRARRYFPSLDLQPLGRLAAFHKHQILWSGALKCSGLERDLKIFNQVLACAAASASHMHLPPDFFDDDDFDYDNSP
jgi:hypothetical protein